MPPGETNRLRAGVVGATGYTGMELLRLLAGHPQCETSVVTSRQEAGRPVCDLFPSLRGACDLAFCDPESADLADCDVAFFATPNGTAMSMVRPLLDRGVKVVDLSADFRLRDAAEWERWYGMPHVAPDLLEEAVYGLPERHRSRIRSARLVANPGCYPTAVALGWLPLLERGVIEPTGLIADVKSGVSGAGRKESMATQLCEAGENLKAYSVAGHRHLPEIRQSLEEAAGGAVDLTFVPHLVPMIRGIHATLYARLARRGADIQEVLESRYAAEPYVDVLPPGSHPETRSVRASNLCRISWHLPQGSDTLVLLSVIDNLVKGAAGQAVQNMNIMAGIEETAGLKHFAPVP